MTRRPPRATPTIWREAKSLLVGERQRFVARRGGLTLRVTVAAHRPLDVVLGLVERMVQPEGRHETVARDRWSVLLSDPVLVASTIDVAKRWAEKEADQLAGER